MVVSFFVDTLLSRKDYHLGVGTRHHQAEQQMEPSVESTHTSSMGRFWSNKKPHSPLTPAPAGNSRSISPLGAGRLVWHPSSYQLQKGGPYQLGGTHHSNLYITEVKKENKLPFLRPFTGLIKLHVWLGSGPSLGDHNAQMCQLMGWNVNAGLDKVQRLSLFPLSAAGRMKRRTWQSDLQLSSLHFAKNA